MIFDTPRIEFIPIDASIIAESSSCNHTTTECSETATNATGGGQRCVGTQPEAKDCPNWQTSIPYSGKKVQAAGHSSSAKSKPENVVGFDLTFDK